MRIPKAKESEPYIKRRQHRVDKEQAKRVRQFMRDSGIKHYIYSIGTLAGAKKAENLYFKTDEEFNQKAEEILSDKWNVEIYALHIND